MRGCRLERTMTLLPEFPMRCWPLPDCWPPRRSRRSRKAAVRSTRSAKPTAAPAPLRGRRQSPLRSLPHCRRQRPARSPNRRLRWQPVPVRPIAPKPAGNSAQEGVQGAGKRHASKQPARSPLAIGGRWHDGACIPLTGVTHSPPLFVKRQYEFDDARKTWLLQAAVYTSDSCTANVRMLTYQGEGSFRDNREIAGREQRLRCKLQDRPLEGYASQPRRRADPAERTLRQRRLRAGSLARPLRHRLPDPRHSLARAVAPRGRAGERQQRQVLHGYPLVRSRLERRSAGAAEQLRAGPYALSGAARRQPQPWLCSGPRLRLTGTDAGAAARAASSRIMSTAFSAIITTGALVLPDTSVGMTEQSTTRRPPHAVHAQARVDHRQRIAAPSCRCRSDGRSSRRCRGRTASSVVVGRRLSGPGLTSRFDVGPHRARCAAIARAALTPATVVAPVELGRQVVRLHLGRLEADRSSGSARGRAIPAAAGRPTA